MDHDMKPLFLVQTTETRSNGSYSKLSTELWFLILSPLVHEWDDQYLKPRCHTRLFHSLQRKHLGPHPLLSLSLSSKYFYTATAPFFNHWVTVRRQSDSILWQQEPLGDVLHHNIARSWRSALVKLIDLQGGNYITRTLIYIPSLHSLTLSDVTIGRKMLEFVCTAKGVREVHLHHSTVKGPLHCLEALNNSNLDVRHLCHVGRGCNVPENGIPSFKVALKISLSSQLQYLELESCDALELFQAHCAALSSLGRPTLPSLAEFVLFGSFFDWDGAMTLALENFLLCTPVLTSLALLEDGSKYNNTDHQAMSPSNFLNHAAPLLRQIAGPFHLLQVLAPGRPLDSVDIYLQGVSEDIDMETLAQLTLMIPSVSHLGIMRWHWSGRVLKTVGPLLPRLKSLSITSGIVSMNTFTRWIKGKLSKHLMHFQDLDNIKLTPRANYFSPTTSARRVPRCPGCTPLNTLNSEEYLQWLKLDGHWKAQPSKSATVF